MSEEIVPIFGITPPPPLPPLISSFNSACDKFLLGILQGFAPGEIQSENDETFFLGLLYINLIEVYSDSQTEDVCSRG